VKPSPTTQFSLDANLDASALTTGPTSTFSAPISVVDSLGATHTLTVTFTKTASNSWKYEVFVPGEDVTGGTAGTPKSLGTGTLTFDNKGQLTSPAAGAPVAVNLAGLADGAADLSLKWNLYNPDTTSTLTQYAQSSATSGTTVDGTAAAELSMVSLGDGGTIVAQFSNGTQQVVGQIALASIPNPDSLISVGQNDYTLGAESGDPTIGAAGTGGRGQVKAGALESSNVDIATEFTHLMTYQRSYEANSRTITTIDQMLQDLMQMKP
jgi:flagellar hook protein FlgE